MLVDRNLNRYASSNHESRRTIWRTHSHRNTVFRILIQACASRITMSKYALKPKVWSLRQSIVASLIKSWEKERGDKIDRKQRSDPLHCRTEGGGVASSPGAPPFSTPNGNMNCEFTDWYKTDIAIYSCPSKTLPLWSGKSVLLIEINWFNESLKGKFSSGTEF